VLAIVTTLVVPIWRAGGLVRCVVLAALAYSIVSMPLLFGSSCARAGTHPGPSSETASCSVRPRPLNLRSSDQVKRVKRAAQPACRRSAET
jgi:hypothetical protein